MERWYVLHTKASAEKRVASILSQRGVKIYLPMIQTISDGFSKQPANLEPLFPGYLFAMFDLNLGNPANWKWIPGLRYLVSFGGVAVTVPDEIVGAIERKICKLQASRVGRFAPFNPGDVVRIKDGPYADMLALFERSCTPGKRVEILLEALDRSYKVKIAPDKLEKVPDGARIGNKRPRRTRGRGRPITSVVKGQAN
jgi:transcriptional antiterminator RfaH